MIWFALVLVLIIYLIKNMNISMVILQAVLSTLELWKLEIFSKCDLLL